METLKDKEDKRETFTARKWSMMKTLTIQDINTERGRGEREGERERERGRQRERERERERERRQRER